MKRSFWHHFKERQQRHDAWYPLCPMYEPVLSFCFWSANQCSGLGKLDAIWASNQVYLSNWLLHLDREQTLISYSEYIDSTCYRVEPKVIHGHDSIYFYHNYHPCYFCYYSRRSFLAEERPLILMLVSHWWFCGVWECSHNTPSISFGQQPFSLRLNFYTDQLML